MAKAGFVTTPNRWFPIESHTRLPLVHWLPRPLMVRTLELCGRPANGIWLLSTHRFKHLFPADLELQVSVQRIAGLPGTITILFRR